MSFFVKSYINAYIRDTKPEDSRKTLLEAMPAQIKVGEEIRNVDLLRFTSDGKPVEFSTHAEIAKRNVVLFTIPAVFAKNSSEQLSGYVAKAKEFKDLGIDTVVCLIPDRAAAMHGWSKGTDPQGEVIMFPDAENQVTFFAGLFEDGGKYASLVAKRSAMIFQDKILKHIVVEKKRDECTETSADELLKVVSGMKLPKKEAPVSPSAPSSSAPKEIK